MRARICPIRGLLIGIPPAAGRPAGSGQVRMVMRASRSGLVQRTSLTQPNFSMIQITRAEMSIWPGSTPCRAQVGSAWWELCQDSPIDRMASGQKFAALSRLAKGRAPIMWQIELIDQVTWCRNDTRTRPAQKNAVTAPHHDQVI